MALAAVRRHGPQHEAPQIHRVGPELRRIVALLKSSRKKFRSLLCPSDQHLQHQQQEIKRSFTHSLYLAVLKSTGNKVIGMFEQSLLK